jgi:Ca2+-binding RTX toxin-like protein
MADVHGTSAGETLNGADGATNGADSIFGYGGNDIIQGLGGNDLIKGGAGADEIFGGSGIDTSDYSDSNAAVAVFLDNGGGVGEGFGGTAEGDTLYGIENVTGSSYADWIIGNSGSNVLNGDKGNDTLEGGGGDDTLKGGSGRDILKGGAGADVLDGGTNIDTADYSQSSAAVNISLWEHTATGGDAWYDTFISIENLTGSDFADRLIGDDGVNVIEGGAGADYLKGAGGDDTLLGGSGADELRGDEGMDILRGGSSGDRLYGGQHNDTLEGESGNDFLYGQDGEDTLNGGTGNDTMEGGTGNDSYYVDSQADVILEDGGIPGSGEEGGHENPNDPNDTIYALINYTLTALNVESLSLTAGTATSLTGNHQTNSLYGNDLDNVLDGGGGNDSLIGFDGNDTFVFHAGQAQADTVYDFDGNGAAAGDTMMFVGYGTLAQGASFVHLAGNDWQVNSADGTIHELITIANGATFDASDLIFV